MQNKLILYEAIVLTSHIHKAADIITFLNNGDLASIEKMLRIPGKKATEEKKYAYRNRTQPILDALLLTSKKSFKQLCDDLTKKNGWRYVYNILDIASYKTFSPFLTYKKVWHNIDADLQYEADVI